MNKFTLPSSPNWFEPSIITCTVDNTVVYGSNGDIVTICCENRELPAEIKIINNAHERIIAVASNSDWGEEAKLLVSIGDEKVVRLWNMATFEFINSHSIHKRSQSKLVGVAFAKDDRIVSVSADGLVVLWRPSLNETCTYPGLLKGKIQVTCVSVCPHATWLAAFGLQKGNVLVADLRKSGKILYNLHGHDQTSIASLTWCPAPFNVFPEEKRIILSAKSRLDKNKDNNTSWRIEDKENSSIITNPAAVSHALIKHLIDVMDNPPVGEETVESVTEKLTDVCITDGGALTSENVKNNPWANLKHVDDEDFVDVEPDPRSLKSVSTDSFDFLSECMALKYRILGECDITESEQDDDPKTSINSDKISLENAVDDKAVLATELDDSDKIPLDTNVDKKAGVSAKLEDSGIISSEANVEEKAEVGTKLHDSDSGPSNIECERKVIAGIDQVKDLQVDKSAQDIVIEGEASCDTKTIDKSLVDNSPPKREFLLASSGKGGSICIWRAGTDGRMQLELAVGNTKKSNYGKSKRETDNKTYVTVCWMQPDILLSSSPNGELLLWDLLKYTGNGRNHKSSVVHNDHRNGIFALVTSRSLRSPSLVSELAPCTAWTVGKDRQLLETALNFARTSLTSYPTFGWTSYCMAKSGIDANRLAIGLADGSVRLWNLSRPHVQHITMTNIHVKSNNVSKCVSLAWHPVLENFLAYSNSNGTVGIINTNACAKGANFLFNFFKSQAHKVEWGPLRGSDDKYALYVCGDGKLVYYDIDKGNEAPVPIDINGEYVTHMAWKSDFSALAVSVKAPCIVLLSPNFDILTSVYMQQKTITQMLWHPIATCNSTSEDVSQCCNWLAIGSITGNVAVYEMSATGGEEKSNLLHEIKGLKKPITSLCWSPYDDGKLATASEDCISQIWDITKKELLSSFISKCTDPISTVLWSPLKEDLIITTSREILEIWNINDHPPKSFEELEKTIKQLLKIKNKYHSRAAEKLCAKQTEAEVTDKPIKKDNLLHLLTRVQNDQRQALLDCRQLLEGDNSDNSIEKNVQQFFGNKDDVMQLLTTHQKKHVQRNKHELAQHLSLWKGDLTETIKTAIANGSVTPWLICMTPMVSPQLWQDACRAYATKCAEDAGSDPVEAASFFLACHDIKAAVRVLSEGGMYREALALAKCRLPLGDEDTQATLTSLLEDWAKDAIVKGNFELAAQCYLALKKYDEAAKALFKRSDFATLQLAMDCTEKGEDSDLKLAVMTRLKMFVPISDNNKAKEIEEKEMKKCESVTNNEIVKVGTDINVECAKVETDINIECAKVDTDVNVECAKVETAINIECPKEKVEPCIDCIKDESAEIREELKASSANKIVDDFELQLD